MTEEQSGQLLTDRQREVLRLCQEGNSVRKIGNLLKVSVSVVHQHLQAARRKLQEQEKLARLMEEVPGGATKTAAELQVLALAGRGMTVKQAAAHLNKSENSLRCILHRSGISAKEFSRRELTPQEREEYSRIKSPREEEEEKLKDKALLKILRACEGESIPSAELELVLKAAGLVRKTPRISAGRRATLNVLRAQSGHSQVVFVLSKVEIKALRKELKRCNISEGLNYFGARLVCVEKDAAETEPSHIYIVSRTSWKNIQESIRLAVLSSGA